MPLIMDMDGMQEREGDPEQNILLNPFRTGGT